MTCRDCDHDLEPHVTRCPCGWVAKETIRPLQHQPSPPRRDSVEDRERGRRLRDEVIAKYHAQGDAKLEPCSAACTHG
jgi:hypothetical protein